MRIDCLADSLKEDYDFAKETVARKLKENVDVLKTYIVDLKNKKNEEILRNLNKFKKASMVVLQCSKIVEGAENSL
jgi:hypothetical protein